MTSLLPGVPLLPHKSLLQTTLDLGDEGLGHMPAMFVAEAASLGPPSDSAPGVEALPDLRSEGKFDMPHSAVLTECNYRTIFDC